MRYDLDNQYALDNSFLIVFAQMTSKQLALRILYLNKKALVLY